MGHWAGGVGAGEGIHVFGITLVMSGLNLSDQFVMDDHGIKADWTAESLAAHTQAVLQGGFILSKTTDDPTAARESAAHLRRYIECLFSSASQRSAA